MTKKNPHVVPVEKGKQWAIKIEGNECNSSIYNTQQEIIEKARSIALKNESEHIIHSRNGIIREKNSYGNDDYPPKG